MPSFRIDGLKELDRALGELPKATGRNVLRRVLKHVAQPVKEAMEAGAPRLTGFTSKSIAVGPKLNPAQRRDQKAETKSSSEIHIGSKRGSAAVFEEFGTIKQPASPYMRPAWNATQAKVISDIGGQLAMEISKAATRVARKKARQAGS